MKFYPILLLCFFTNWLKGQDFDKSTIQSCYYEGLLILDKINEKDTLGLSVLFDEETIDTLIQKTSLNEYRFNKTVI